MLAIRMQRTGRKGHPEFRVVVQEARLSPSSGRVVKQVGSYNPHTKALKLDKELAAKFLSNGAQPSPRVVKLLESEGVKLPEWVLKADASKKRDIRNPDKLRRNQPAEEPVVAEAPAEETPSAEAEVAPATETEEAVVAEAPTDEPA